MNVLDPARAWIARTSLAWRCAVLIILVCAALLGPGAGMFYVLRKTAREQRIVEQLDVALAGIESDDAAGIEPGQPARERLAPRAGALRWVGRVEPDGACVELLRRTGMPKREIVAQLASAPPEPSVRPLVIDGAPSERFELLAWRDSGAAATFAAIIDRSTALAPPRSPRAALAALALCAALGVALALAWVRYAIVRPLEALGRRLTIPHAGLLPSLPILAVPDELEGVACTLESLAKDVERWRVEAAFLRQTIETAVDARARGAQREADRARREADTDQLTQLGNRRFLDRELPRLFDEHTQRETELALLVIDVDHFKNLNDTRGHQAGDALIAFIGELLGSLTRRGTDLAARLGGDEFVVALPGVSVDDALAVARRIAALFAQRVRTLAPIDPAPALSIGVAERRRHAATTPVELLRMADVAMYYAKRARRGVSTLPSRASAKPPGRPAAPC
jgi:diguanylate cyclase (GGDEF)-like protein